MQGTALSPSSLNNPDISLTRFPQLELAAGDFRIANLTLPTFM